MPAQHSEPPSTAIRGHRLHPMYSAWVCSAALLFRERLRDAFYDKMIRGDVFLFHISELLKVTKGSVPYILFL